MTSQKKYNLLNTINNEKLNYTFPPQLTTPNKYKKWTNNINYIPIGLIKSLCGNDRIFAKDLKPYCFKPTPKVVENTNIIVKFIGK